MGILINVMGVMGGWFWVCPIVELEHVLGDAQPEIIFVGVEITLVNGLLPTHEANVPL